MSKYELILGDSCEVLPELEAHPNLILTSPPYDGMRSLGGHAFDFDRMADAIAGVMDPGAVLVWIVADQLVNGGESGTSFRQALGFMDRDLTLHETLIYQSSQEVRRTPNRHGGPSVCYMFVFSNGKPATVNLIIDKVNKTAGKLHATGNFGRNVQGVNNRWNSGKPLAKLGTRLKIWSGINGSKDGLAHEHPAIFPLALAKDLVKTYSNPGDLVLDPMMGSGTTVRAAVDLGRDAIGVEVHAPYVDLVFRRMAQEVLL